MINYFCTYGNKKVFDIIVGRLMNLGYDQPSFAFSQQIMYLYLNPDGKITYSQNTDFIKERGSYQLRPLDDLLDPEKSKEFTLNKLEVNGFKVFVEDKKLRFGCQIICAEDVEQIIKLWRRL